MNLKPCKKTDLRKTPKSDLFALINQFAESDCECAEVCGAVEHYCSTNCGANTINRAIKKYKIPKTKAIVNDGKIYLIKE